MKRLAILFLVLCLMGGIAWAVGAMMTETAANRWLQDRRSEGWVVNTSEVSVRGFPTVFSTEFQNLDLADPETGLAWSAPRFRIDHEVFRLDRISAHWPPEQSIATPSERLTLTTSAMNAMLDVQPTNRFALDMLDGQIADLRILSTEGWTLSLAVADLEIDRRHEASNFYEISLDAQGFVPPEAVRRRLDPASVLPDAMERLELVLQATFDAPWDLDSIEVARPQPVSLTADRIDARWGEMLFRASGTLDVNEGGRAEGDLAVRAENWEAMMQLAVNAGVVPSEFEASATAMLRVLAGMSGRPENIDATLTFANGRTFLGPLPIGPAPVLRIP